MFHHVSTFISHEGLFDEVGSECFNITPTTFTFACEPEAATLTDTTSVFDGVDVTEFTRDFYLIPGDDPTPVPRAPIHLDPDVPPN